MEKNKGNGIDPEVVKSLKSVLQNGDMMSNLSKVAELLAEPKQGGAVKKLLTNKALEKVQEGKKMQEEMANVDPRLNLLLAIKPFLTQTRADKVDKITKSMSLGSLFKDLNKLI